MTMKCVDSENVKFTCTPDPVRAKVEEGFTFTKLFRIVLRTVGHFEERNAESGHGCV